MKFVLHAFSEDRIQFDFIKDGYYKFLMYYKIESELKYVQAHVYKFIPWNNEFQMILGLQLDIYRHLSISFLKMSTLLGRKRIQEYLILMLKIFVKILFLVLLGSHLLVEKKKHQLMRKYWIFTVFAWEIELINYFTLFF